MKLTDYPHNIRHALAMFEALRRFDFSSDDIYFRVGAAIGKPLDVPHFFITIEKPVGTQLFTYLVEELKGDIKVFHDSLVTAMNEWNEAGRERERQDVYQTELALGKIGTPLVNALIAKGILKRNQDGKMRAHLRVDN